MSNLYSNPDTYPNDPRPRDIQSDTGGWLTVVVGALVIMTVVFGLATLYGPHDQATIASDIRPDGAVTGNGNTVPPAQTTGGATTN
jgi:predicted phage tail protein